MRKGIRFGVPALAALAVLALPASASAAYTTPTLKVSQSGTTTTLSATVAPTDDATARAVIYAAAGVQVTLNQPPGTKLGTAVAQASALDLGGALLPLEGDVVVAPPGAVTAQVQTACTQGQAPAATWLMSLQAAGQPLNIPVFVVLTSGTEAQLGPAKLIVCLGPPDIPAGAPGRAVFGAKLTESTLTLDGVFGVAPLAPWLAMWTPYQAGNGQPNAAGTVASPSVIASSALTVGRVVRGARTTIAGRATQAQQGLARANVQIFAGKTRAALKRIRTVRANANGAYSFTTRNPGPFFRSRVVLPVRPAPQLCQQLAAQLPVPCVNGQVSGVSLTSRVVRR
ncbi:MAG TPA: hypothetical protein VH950_00870 [Gaiellaceae bacterium]|jgi:hypothetical protein